jgi:hypothetical protein
MARQVIDTSTIQANGKRGEPAPTAFGKINDNFLELYGLTGLGGISESGVNGNGYWIKFVQGTLVCFHRLDPGQLPANGGTIGVAWTFPAVFTNIPSVHPGACSAGGYGYTLTAALDDPPTTASCAFSAINRFTSAKFLVLFPFAIGRWK